MQVQILPPQPAILAIPVTALQKGRQAELELFLRVLRNETDNLRDS